MKTISWTRYGPPEVLVVRETDKPTPKDKEILIKVSATTVTMGDCEARAFKFPALFWIPLRIVFGIFKPRKATLGQELAGEVEAVGKKVTRFKGGDQVFASTLLRFNAYTEYACLPETYPIAQKPASISYDEAATIPTGGFNALHFVRKSKIQPGEKVLINGAGGSIGTYAVQLAKLAGAEVTCVDSKPKLEMLRSIGSNHMHDYAQFDFTKGNEKYDVIIDIIGKSHFSRSVACLKPGGRYILGNPNASGMVRALWTSATSDKHVVFEPAAYKLDDLVHLRQLMESGKIKSVIDKKYNMDQVVEAHTYVDSGHKAGHVVIRIGE